jgi:histidinol-phosphatase
VTQSTLLNAVSELAVHAGGIALSHYKTGIETRAKADGSPVTAADFAAESAAREWISSRFPDDGIVGEELGALRPDAKRRWIVDPIDGTKSFVRGVPLWGTLVAVAEGDTVLAGAAHFPALNELVSAALGEGCYHNSVRTRVSPVSELRSATLLTTSARFERMTRQVAFGALAERVAVTRTWGDCYGYMLVATGRAEVMVDDVANAWDAAAMQPIIAEAGGRFTDWRGRETAFGGDVIATNAALAGAVRAALGEAS